MISACEPVNKKRHLLNIQQVPRLFLQVMRLFVQTGFTESLFNFDNNIA